MNNYFEKAVDFFSNSKKFANSVIEKVALKAKRSGKSFKEYIHDNENVSHISLVVYDLLPLPLKFAMRYEKFDKAFVNNFGFIRQKLFMTPVKEAQELVEVTSSKKPTPAKKVAVKRAVSKKVAVPIKKAPAKKSTIVKSSEKPQKAITAKKTVKKTI